MSDCESRAARTPPAGARGSETGRSDPPAADASGAHALLAVATEAATGAGALLLERAHHGAERHVSSKSTPTDLVSEADLASERAIRELLARRRPDDGFVGEEGDHVEGTNGLSWVVDPLDGTVNFLFGIPQWCVSVAVRDARGTVAGAIYDPNRDELFSAARGAPAALSTPRGTIALGASCAVGGRAIDGEDAGAVGAHTVAGAGASATRPWAGDLAMAMIATGLAYDARVRIAQGRVLAGLVGRVRDIRRFGSAALDLAWTAAGRYDAYFERSVKQWDIAAGVLICESAGLRVLELPEREDLPWGILVARLALCEELLALVG
ncbi:MAG TPA: inositol monophosphatase family protein [Solirubrobacteraceae bacterium]|nr:inositol monophosphatase family protein [Solirubrobacteraceae bacterium]